MARSIIDSDTIRVRGDTRHGSPYRKSYTAAELNPYRRAAVEWLMANEDDRLIANAIQQVRGLYDRAGPHIEAFRLRGLPPKDRARAAWARLRHHGVDPRIVIAAWIAVEAITCNDPQAKRKREYHQVQAAKIVHRLASGSHKRWNEGPSAGTELHVYPASRGQVLRHIGADLEGAVELLAERAVSAISTDKNGAKRGTPKRPNPRRLRGRRRAA